MKKPLRLRDTRSRLVASTMFGRPGTQTNGRSRPRRDRPF